VIDPPPLATAKVTSIPGTPLPWASATFTEGRFVTGFPTTPVCPFDEAFAIVIAAAGPGVKVTSALSASEAPSSFAVTIAVPLAVDEVRVAVKEPLPPSTTGDIEPIVVVSCTVPTGSVTGVPSEAFSATVITDVDDPFATIDEGDAVTVES
jgi:hypothetical protein